MGSECAKEEAWDERAAIATKALKSEDHGEGFAHLDFSTDGRTA
jgi:hypothetical protein